MGKAYNQSLPRLYTPPAFSYADSIYAYAARECEPGPVWQRRWPLPRPPQRNVIGAIIWETADWRRVVEWRQSEPMFVPVDVLVNALRHCLTAPHARNYTFAVTCAT